MKSSIKIVIGVFIVITLTAITLIPLLSFPDNIPPVQAYDDGQAYAPPMGWNSWNRFTCDIDEQLIHLHADRLVKTGLRALGYRYVIVDDCWQGGRDAAGILYADPQRFPNGIKKLAEYVHKRGLKFGLYSSLGATSCTGRVGSLGYEVLDAQTFASWGVDYLKYDNCDYSASNEEIQRRFITMGNALRQTGRTIVYSIAAAPFQDWYPTIAHLARTGSDIRDDWDTMLNRFDINASTASFAHPGFWNDPDVLEIGSGGMTQEEYKTYFSLWAISAAPLILSVDLANLDSNVYRIIANKEVIAIDQDRLGVQAVKIAESVPGLQVWAKRLHGSGAWAIVLLNRTLQPASITVSWGDLGIVGPRKVRDVWQRINLGEFPDNYSTMVQPHGVVFVRVN